MNPSTEQTAPVPALEYAKLLCHSLARVTSGLAYVVNDNGHAMLATPEDIGVYWHEDQIVYTANCAPPTFAAVQSNFTF